MWENDIVQENVKKLKKFGYYFIEPEEGELASGKTGKGRLAKVEKIIDFVEKVYSNS
jgi:phosphopantothenoylcysteine decarboxylase/phosphopantothenate--cysteine ligase